MVYCMSIQLPGVAMSALPAVHHLHPQDFARYSLVELFDEVRSVLSQTQALQYRLAALLRELDRREHVDGKPVRLTRWLHHTFGFTFGTAREKVRTARALGALPHIDEAFKDGRLSSSQVRALTRVATPENEADLLEKTVRLSAEGVEHVVRRMKQQACLEDVQALIDSRSLSTRWDETGALVIQGRLTPDQGAVFLKALARAAEQQESVDDEEAYWARQADALTGIMADSLSGEADGGGAPGDRHQVVVHVPAETFSGEDGPEFHPETLRRLACDGGLVTVIENESGEVLNVGRKTRAIPPATRRALLARDRHCQFPGCSNTRFVEGHHIVHWAQGGETKLSNLVLLCSHHHRAVHEMGVDWEVVSSGVVEPFLPVHRKPDR